MKNQILVAGHAPGHLRDRFIELAEDGEPSPELYELAGQLRRCTDIVLGSDCRALDLPAGSTYGQVARHILSAE